MRFLGIGDAADLASLYLRLAEDGHEVKIFIGNPLCRDTLAGLVPRVDDWQTELPWIRAAGDAGCILFENVGAGRGELQDRLRRDGFNVIGSSAYGARLENVAPMPSGFSVSWDFPRRRFSSSAKLKPRGASLRNGRPAMS